MSGPEKSGIVLYTPDDEPVRVVLMDETDDRLQFIGEVDPGIYGYESDETTITMLLEHP